MGERGPELPTNTFNDAMEEVRKERGRARRAGYTDKHDDAHSNVEWVELIRDRIPRAQSVADDDVFVRQMAVIAQLATAAIASTRRRGKKRA